MKALPYFRWFPADAKADEAYSSMTDQELGFYHRCLNHAWLNDGLPSEMDKLATVMHVDRKYLEKVWPAVGKCFSLTDTIHPRFVNRRQEMERDIAIGRVQQAVKAVTARELKKNRRSSRDHQEIISGSSGDHLSRDDPRAYVSVSETSSFSLERGPGENQPSYGFPAFWSRWVEVTKRGKGETQAANMWTAYVNFDEEGAAMACLERYLSSAEVARGVITNPDKWIREESENKWRSTWQGTVSPVSGNSARRSEVIAGLKIVEQIKGRF